MPRLKVPRKIMNPPVIKGFKPYGPAVSTEDSEPVSLLYEEYESLKLCDYDLLNHNDAAIMMNVSRPTFTRIYASSRRKIAKAFSEGRQIIIEGGKIYFDSDWYFCLSCGSYFNKPDKENALNECPLCGSDWMESYYEDAEKNKTQKL
jgi:uncharacterized protein